MWSFSRVRQAGRAVAIAVAFAAPLALAGCAGFTPVYGEHGLTTGKIALAYAEPASRLDQIIYQQLALQLGKAPRGDAPMVTVVATQSTAALTSGTIATPARQRQVTVTAVVTLTDRNGKKLFAATRTASAGFSTGPQILANNAAETEAAERAAKSLADTIRLTLLAALAQKA